MGDTMAAGIAGPGLVELLPRVLHEAPAAVLLVDLAAGEVTYANQQGLLMAPDTTLPARVDAWSDAAGLLDPEGIPLSDSASPLARVAAGEPVAGEPVTAARRIR